jgi:hypothetical protein
VRVPEEAGSDKAKVTLKFSDWKEGNVAPASYHVPIVDGQPEAKK